MANHLPVDTCWMAKGGGKVFGHVRECHRQGKVKEQDPWSC